MASLLGTVPQLLLISCLLLLGQTSLAAYIASTSLRFISYNNNNNNNNPLLLPSQLYLQPPPPPQHRGGARFFLDTANEKEWETLLTTGMFHGVTTNPFVLQQVNQPCTIDNVRRMAQTALQYSSVHEFVCQTWGATVDELYQTGLALSEPARQCIVIKVPVTVMGVQAATRLIRAGCRVCLTAVYNAQQALTAVAIGAEYLAPCVGIMDTAAMAKGSSSGSSAAKECRAMLEIVQGLGSRTRVLVACVRDVELLCQLAQQGMDTCSLTPEIAKELLLVTTPPSRSSSQPPPQVTAAPADDEAVEQSSSSSSETLVLQEEEEHQEDKEELESHHHEHEHCE